MQYHGRLASWRDRVESRSRIYIFWLATFLLVILSLSVNQANAAPPTNSIPPKITGTYSVGSTLTGSDGTWADVLSATTVRQWQSSSDGSSWLDISGATGSTYLLTSAEAGKFIRFKVVRTTNEGSTSAFSQALSGTNLTGTNLFANSTIKYRNSGGTETAVTSSSTYSWISCSGTRVEIGVRPGERLIVALNSPRPNLIVNLFGNNVAQEFKVLFDDNSFITYTQTSQIYAKPPPANTQSDLKFPVAIAQGHGGNVDVAVSAPEGKNVSGFEILWTTDTWSGCSGLFGFANSTFNQVPAAVASAPTALSASAGNASAVISFTDPASNGGASITNYKYSTNGSTYTALSPADSSSPVTIPGLTNGTSYSITLKAVNSAGDSVASTAVSVTPFTTPGAPTSLTAVAGNGSATISFTAPASNGGSAITNYKYSTDGTLYNELNPPDATSPILIPDLTNGTAYSITLKAVNAAGDSIASSSVSVTPDGVAPTASVTTATILNTGNASVQSSEVGTAYLVNQSVTVTNVASITGAADNLQNSVSIATANTNTNLAATGLLPGIYKVYTVDSVGNLSNASTNTISIKPATPGTPDLEAASDLGTSNTDNNTADDSPTFTVSSLVSGALVTLTATPATGSPVTCPAFTATSTSGSCTFTAMSNGTYSITAIQSFGGVNSDTSTALANVVINKLVISTPATPDLQAASDTGSSDTDNITRVNTPAISFTGSATISASKAGSTSVTCTTSSNACTLGALSDGVWSITATTTDTSGNSATSAALSITIDTQRPTVTFVDEILPGNGATLVAQLTSTEAGFSYIDYGDVYATQVAGIMDSTRVSQGKSTSAVIQQADQIAQISYSGLTRLNENHRLFASDIAGNLSLAALTPGGANLNIVPRAPTAPSSLSTNAPSGTTIFGQTLTNAVTYTGAPTPNRTFQWKRCTSSTDLGTCVDISGSTSSTYVLSAEDVGRYIRTVVTASNGVLPNRSDTSSATSIVIAAPPGIPTAVSATITGSTTATVSFTAPSSNGGSQIIEYIVTSTPSGATCTVGANSTTYNCTGLTANTPYTFKVKARNTAGTGSDSVASSSQTTHIAPTFSSTSGTASFPRLSNDVFEEFEGPGPSTGITVTVNGVAVPISTDPATGNVSIALKASSWTSTATYGSLSGYMLNFYNSTLAPLITFPSGVSQFRFLVAGLAVQPTLLLSYTNGSTSDTITLNTGGGETAPYVITITAPAGKFINSFRITPPSQDWWHLDNISYVAALSTTTSVSSKSLTAGTAVTSFTPITASGGGSSKSYSITPSLPAGLSLNTSTGAITGTPTSAIASTSYTVTVSDGPSTSSASFTLGVNAALSSTAGTVPSAIYKDVAVTAFTPISFSGGTSPITYSVSPSLPAGLSLNTSTGAITGTATGIAANTSYTVTATDANSDTEASTFAFAVTNQPTAPGAPTNVVGTATGQTSATVAFTAPTSTGGAAINSYTVTASPGGVTATGSSSPITISGLTAGTPYTFSVTATNAAGLTSSSSSPSGSVTTESAPVQNNNNSGGGGSGGNSGGGSSAPTPAPVPVPEPAPEPVCNAACVAAQNAAAKAAADKAAAEKAAAEKLAADKAAAVTVVEKTKVDIATAVAAATAAVEKVSAAAAAKVAADTIVAAVSTVVNTVNATQASTTKVVNDAVASIKSAPAAAIKAASTASANTAANTAASQVRAAATAAQKTAATSQQSAPATPEITFGSSNTASAASQAAANANAAARAGKVAANEVAATAETRAVESKAAATALQNEANAAVAEAIAEQKVATALALEAKSAADRASSATAEKIAATAAAKIAAETLVTLLNEKVATAEKLAGTVAEDARAEAQKILDAVNGKIAEAEKVVAEATSKADTAINTQAEAVKAAEASKASAEAQIVKVNQLRDSVPVKATAAVRAAAVAAVAAKVATAAKEAAAKVPSRAVISSKPGVSTGKNSTRATISGLKPGQKVKVTVNVKPKP